ncbi:lysylphosphatidylglycerol synthase domain-containing protein [Roseibium salinum]|uniref:Lysylphosphatidylglycerol synthase domain-containing protein n=1 Tax=Roseibium salinum TaxID=1604349 RepID=A0ABT3R974_9HYPH|nr:lysylphosphatidylglycerol synthase domain-containing protein [Roseibium sp. DSM 29163]MCX2725665.1 lysylphosphatidylglycerol synthase domain-containing protein [Roseibium sp. DSM 29163]
MGINIWLVRLKAVLSPAVLNDPVWRRAILIIAALGFVAGIGLSMRAQPGLLSNLDWRPVLCLILIGIPVTVVLNTLEFRATARLIGRSFTFARAAETTIIGGVANMLPLPGGAIVRVAALRASGSSYKEGSLAIVLVAFIWIGVSFAYAGGWLLVLQDTAVLGVFFLLGGILLLALCVGLTIWFQRVWRQTAILVVIKIGLVLVDAMRLYFCFHALGPQVEFGQVSVLTVSGALGAAVSIVPAGLGIREAFAAVLGPAVGLTASSAYLATSLNRVFGLAMLSPIALFLAVRQKRASRV